MTIPQGFRLEEPKKKLPQGFKLEELSSSKPEANREPGTSLASKILRPADIAYRSAAEFAGGVNKGVLDIVDFLGPDQFNTVMEAVGSDVRMPKLAETGLGKKVTQSGFIKGLPGEALRAAGEIAPSALGVGAATRTIASKIPKATNLAGGAVKQLAKGTTSAGDIVIGAGSGAGSVIGEEIGGAPGKVIGGVVGGLGASGLKNKIFNYGKLTPRQQGIIKELQTNPRNPDLAKFSVINGKPKATKKLKEAIKQFGSPETIAVAKASSPSDKIAFKKMVNIIKSGKKDPLFKDANRVGDVVGDSLRNRVVALKGVLNRSGKKIDEIAKAKLKGKEVDISTGKENFKAALEKLRVGYNPSSGAVIFKDSALEGSKAGQARSLVQRLARRFTKDVQKAEDVHFAKRLIDQDTAFGTSDEGLKGEVERAIKGFRRDLNQSLRDKFPEYKKANKTYSDAINAIDNLQAAAGSKLNLDNPVALGTKARSFTNNTQTRANLIESMNEIQDVLAKNKIKFKDDILTQVNVANSLEQRFKTQGSTAFRSEIEKAGTDVMNKGIQGTLLERGLEATAKKVTGVTDDKALDALLKILE